MTRMDDKRRPAPEAQSAAEQTLRERMPAVIERISKGATIQSALRTAGYHRSTITRIVSIGNGGQPDVTDDGLRDACELLIRAGDAAASEVDAVLEERWKFLATVGDDWRSIAELLRRRNPDVWNVTDKSAVEIGGTIGVRSEDAVLEALERLQAESEPDAPVTIDEPILPNEAA